MDLRILAMCAVLLADQSAVAFLRAPGHTGARPPPVRTPCPARWERIDGAPPAPRRALTPHRSALRAHERKPIGVGGGELQRLSDVPFRLGMPAREVYVWLPPGYNEARAAGQRFPVIYCQDGQNKMDARTSWLNADWNLGRAATLLLEEGKIRAPIFVLIYNSGTLRRIEYGDNPVGRAYVDWMCDDLKPRIDREFASLPAPRHTMALGSSMGGSISYLATLWRPDSFAAACALSPMFEPQTIASVLARSQTYERAPYLDHRVYIDNGGDTLEKQVPWVDARDGDQGGYWWLDSQFQAGVDAMLLALRLQGLPPHSPRLRFLRFPGARHNERAWRRRVREPLLFLLGSQP